MKLKEILKGLDIVEIIGSTDINVGAISFDSRDIINGSLFIAVKGTKTDGHNYIKEVIKKGAIAIVCEQCPEQLEAGSWKLEVGSWKGLTIIKVADSSAAVGYIASNYYGNASKKLKLVGITGTNGKTTVATLLYELFREAGYKTGLISTVKYKINDKEVKARHTTPDGIELNYLLRMMVEEGCTHCFMEVSSHSIVQGRIAGLEFSGGVFTNITQDHLDYHKTMDEYFKAKKTFFDKLPKDAFALTNIDDRKGKAIIENSKAVKKTYSMEREADFRGRILLEAGSWKLEAGKSNTRWFCFSGLKLEIDGVGTVRSKLVGRFNAYNLLAIYATAILLEFKIKRHSSIKTQDSKSQILSILSHLKPVEGRFEVFQVEKRYKKSEVRSQTSKITAIVDYAHTPDALLNVLKTIHEILDKRDITSNVPTLKAKDSKRKVITVVGCGGDRDKSKRPLMGKIAFQYSDKVILTSDNPRSEEATLIIGDMLKGIPKKEQGTSEKPIADSKVVSIVDRKEAIKAATLLAKSGDIILVAGKGHEDYQEIKGVRTPFNDKKVLLEIMNNE